MTNKILMALAFLAGTAWPAGPDPAGFASWKSAELKAYAGRLSPKMNELKVATEQLATYGNHLVMVAHREASGEAEVHETTVDIFVPQSGTATLVVGGTVVGGRSTGPGEIRGASIQGGTKTTLGPGDIIHIPAKTPHQVLLDHGKFTYVIVKVEDKGR